MYSAYELAVANGYTGSIEDFFDSIWADPLDMPGHEYKKKLEDCSTKNRKEINK